MLQIEGLVDQVPPGDIGPVDQGDRDALGAGTTGAADPVDIGLVVVGALVVDHVADPGDVDPASGHVGADQDVHLVLVELLQRLLPRHLVQIAVDGGCLEAAIDQFVGEALRGSLRPGEDHGLGAVLGLQDPADDLRLVQIVRLVDVLIGVRHGHVGVDRLGADVDRLVQVAPGQSHNRRRHRGREEQGLPGRRGLGDQPLHVGQEAHVEHLVRLVEDQHPHVREVQRATGHQVEQSARGADDHVDATAELTELVVVTHAAVDGQDPGLAHRRGHLKVAGDLKRELAGGAHHQRLRLPLVGEVGVFGVGGNGDPLQQADPEGQRLAGARPGLADHVGAGQGDRDGEGLDREGVFNAHRRQRFDDLGANAQVGEGVQVVSDRLVSGLGMGDVAQSRALTVVRPRSESKPVAPRGRPACGRGRTRRSAYSRDSSRFRLGPRETAIWLGGTPVCRRRSCGASGANPASMLPQCRRSNLARRLQSRDASRP